MGALENDIKQTSFSSEKQKCILNILYTSNWIRDKTASFFKEHDILQQHYNVLRIVKGQKGEPTSPGQIIAVMLDKGRDLTRLVDKLVRIGYLKRSNSLLNRRKVEITLTEKGEAVIDLIGEKLDNFYDTLEVNENAAQELNQTLDSLRD